MRVFNNSTQPQSKSNSSSKSEKSNKAQAKPRRLSQSEVQRRVEELKNEKLSGTSLRKRKRDYERSKMSQYMDGGIFKGDKRPQNLPSPETVVVGEELELNDSPNTADYVLGSDIASNKPDAEETREKLKGVLSKGAFKFSAKERDVLSKILED